MGLILQGLGLAGGSGLLWISWMSWRVIFSLGSTFSASWRVRRCSLLIRSNRDRSTVWQGGRRRSKELEWLRSYQL